MEPDAFCGHRVLVTGAAGFIGRRLAAALAARGARVVGFDRAPSAAAGTRFRSGDVRNRGALGDAVSGAEVIFHLAAANGHRRSMERPLDDFETNLVGMTTLLAAARERAPRARIVFASTRQLYGRARALPAPEDHPLAPPDAHSVHKEAAEHLGRIACRAGGVRFSALRLTNTYGPGQAADARGGFVARFLAEARSRGEITILGDPNLRRDLNHVDDVVEAFLRAGRPGAPAGTWNLGGPPATLGEVARAIFRALGKPGRIRPVPLAPELAAIAIGDFFADWSAIRRDLGWAPRVSLEAGLAETVRGAP